MAVSAPIRPADRLLAGYNVALAAVWAALVGGASYAPWICAAHAAAATLPWLLERAGNTASPALRGLREVYPLLLLLGFWSELGLVRELLHAAAHDEIIRAADVALFGVHVHEVWMPAMPAVWFSEVMHLVYFVYDPLILVLPIAAGLRGRRAAQRDMTFRLLVTYLGCYVLYLAFPVDGPSNTMTRYAGDLTGGFYYRLVQGVIGVGDSLGTAFPSSHVAGATTIAVFAWRWYRPAAAALLTVEAAGVFVATVYTQNHYAIDAVAGLATDPLIPLLLHSCTCVRGRKTHRSDRWLYRGGNVQSHSGRTSARRLRAPHPK